jgi:voltage-gated potassium channel
VRLVLVANRATRAAGEIFSRHRFQYVLSIIVLATLMAAAGVFYFEQGVPGTPFVGFGDALWWAATMTTTVNVGAEPLTVEGRIIGLLLRVVGLATFGYVTASIASFLIDERVAERESPKAGRDMDQTEAILHLTREVEHLRAAVEAMRTRPIEEDARDAFPPRDRAA